MLPARQDLSSKLQFTLHFRTSQSDQSAQFSQIPRGQGFCRKPIAFIQSAARAGHVETSLALGRSP